VFWRPGLDITGYELALGASAVSIEPQPHFALTFDADTKLVSSATGGPPTLSGNVRLSHFNYGRHIELPQALVALNQSDRRNRAQYDPAHDHVVLDLVLTHTEPLVVRNNFLDAELEVKGDTGKLRLVGTDQRFGVLGALTVSRGRVLFHGDEFQISRGQMTFDDEQRVAPVFDVRAVAQKRTRKDASIVFEARGDREAFRLGVRCDAGAATVLAEPFACDFVADHLRCDRFEQLVDLWACPVRGVM